MLPPSEARLMSFLVKGELLMLLLLVVTSLVFQPFCDMLRVSTMGVFGRMGTTSFSCVEKSSAVGVLERNRKPDFGFMLPSSFFLNLFLAGLLRRPRWMVMAASWPLAQSFRTWTTSLWLIVLTLLVLIS